MADRTPRDMVLLVDDDRDELHMLVEALEEAGLTVLVATGGEEALGILERATPDLIVMDAVMAGIDGFEACRNIRRQPRFALLPVIFLTGLKDTGHVLEGLAAGGVDYVAKPVIIAELVARIRIHISNARAAFNARVALDAAGRRLIAVDSTGAPLWCTPQSVSLLASHYGPIEDLAKDLPEPALLALKNALANRERKTTFKVGEGQRELSFAFLTEVSANEVLFVMGEADAGGEDKLAQGFGLTSREAEVLRWISRGKSNQDIAEILNISPRTAQKHLERIFAKLGVENRSSAAALALQALAKSV
jgi:DNA-binding NarL/FixJ family response regulator